MTKKDSRSLFEAEELASKTIKHKLSHCDWRESEARKENFLLHSIVEW